MGELVSQESRLLRRTHIWTPVSRSFQYSRCQFVKRYLFLLAAALACSSAFAQETWLGIYLQGQKIGYSSYALFEAGNDGTPPKRSESLTVMNSEMLGSALNLTIKSKTTFSVNGKPATMWFETESAGRKQTLWATFKSSTIELDLDNSGVKNHKSIPMPKDGQVLDDPTAAVLGGANLKPGKKVSFYVLDPMTVSLVKNSATYVGKTKVTVAGKEYDAEQILIDDPRAQTKVFMSSKGDMIKMEGPMGIEMLPESKEVAMGNSKPTEPKKDLAFSTSIKTDRAIDDPWKTTFVKLDVSGVDLKRMPTDNHQTVVKQNGGWLVSVHPSIPTGKLSIAAAKKAQPKWVQPGLHIPSTSATFTKLAKTIVGKETAVLPAAKKVKAYVYGIMTPNAGIGVLRDASEVLKTKEGVCRDYAILTATLMRAAGIPTKVVSGLVYAEGAFFYHAWVEIWDGKHWVGVDSTRPEENFSATHVKIADGSVEDAFTFFVLDGANVKVLEVKH